MYIYLERTSHFGNILLYKIWNGLHAFTSIQYLFIELIVVLIKFIVWEKQKLISFTSSIQKVCNICKEDFKHEYDCMTRTTRYSIYNMKCFSLLKSILRSCIVMHTFLHLFFSCSNNHLFIDPIHFCKHENWSVK